MTCRRLRAHRLLIVGCGDVGLRVLRLLGGRHRVLATTSTPERAGLLRAAGAVPLLADLDDAPSLRRLAGLADAVLLLAPPAPRGHTDERTRALLRALSPAASPVRRLVYVSTTGVYGDAQGALCDETRPAAPLTDRARRRVDAERQLRRHALATGSRVTLLRAPGIHALDRVGGDPGERVARGSPVLRPAEDVYTNHIHADDLARACIAALWRGRPQRAVNASDDGTLTMGDHYDLVADLCGLPRPPRISLEAARAQLSPMALSFLGESRRLDNRRLKRELRVRLRYPTVRDLYAARGTPAP